MALQKSIPTEYGVNATYWKICQFNVDSLNQRAHVELLGFISQDAREQYPACLPIASRSFDWPPGIMQFGHGVNNFEIAYQQIKAWTTTDAQGNTVPGEFADAIDV